MRSVMDLSDEELNILIAETLDRTLRYDESYPVDADFALSLPLSEGLAWQILGKEFAPNADAKPYQVCIVEFGPFDVGANGRVWKLIRAVNADTIARGACCAWLKWKGIAVV